MTKPRNLSNKCKDCPYKDDWGLYDCVNNALPYLVDKGIRGESCGVPWDILKDIERKRNGSDKRKEI